MPHTLSKLPFVDSDLCKRGVWDMSGVGWMWGEQHARSQARPLRGGGWGEPATSRWWRLGEAHAPGEIRAERQKGRVSGSCEM